MTDATKTATIQIDEDILSDTDSTVSDELLEAAAGAALPCFHRFPVFSTPTAGYGC